MRSEADSAPDIDADASLAAAMSLSLRAKGLVAFAVLVVYMAIVGLVLNAERQRLLDLATDLERIHERDAALLKASHAINHSMLRLQALLHAATLGVSFGEDVALDVELVQSALQSLQKYFPEFDDEVARIAARIAELRRTPSRAALVALQTEEHALDRRLTEIDVDLREARTGLWSNYHRIYDRMTLLAVTMNLIGVMVFGALITLFFSRLAWDVRKVGERAADVVDGYRGPLLEITRTDEVGDLLGAVNRTQLALRQREQKLELAREQRFHRERMAAMGSLATAVAHEINNPIAAIAGIAQTMAQAEASGRTIEKAKIAEGARLILEQTQRISAISRQVAELTRPRPAKAELLDLNALIRNTCRFIGFDKRLRGIDLKLELDARLPAVCTVADHVTQVLMNLVLNAADALESPSERKPAIEVSSRMEGDEVVLSVVDNGHGMDADTLAHAFEESFSTKSADKGRGLGLYLCKQLVEQSGGSVRLASSLDQGTVATVRLPLRPRAPAS